MKEIRKKWLKSIKSFFKETKDDTRKKAKFKLIVMLVLFLFLIICARFSSGSSSTLKSTENQSFAFKFDEIEKGNYHFEYIESVNGNSHTYTGDKNKEIEKFNDGVDYFYKNHDAYYKMVNNHWESTNTPYLFSEFLNIENVKETLRRSTMLSKTQYREGRQVFTYQISTTTLQEIINHEQIDIEDIPNEVMITTDNTDNVVEIGFKLDSYAIYNQLGILANTNIKYSNFGKVEKIEIN